MTQNTPVLPNWFVTDDCRAKAKIKYELKHLESRLNKYLELHNEVDLCPDEVISLCHTLANRYLDYLKLIGEKNRIYSFEPTVPDVETNWLKLLHAISNLRAQLSTTLGHEEEINITLQIASLYNLFKNKTYPLSEHSDELIETNIVLGELNELFQEADLKLWLVSLVGFWNQNNAQHLDLSILFRDWDLQQQQLALNYFSAPELVDLINAIFFYKLYPDKLFDDLIHPEKLVSVRMRLGVLHHFIELLQKQLYNSAQQHGLKSGIDYLFHGNELPQGIMIEVNEEFRDIIQSAIKKLKIVFTPENEVQVTLERLHDLGLAYKFWFNPNRLIDAVMVLQQRLVKTKTTEENNLLVFHQEMVVLYSQLTTTECLDLYGYFANNDTRYLLYTLYTLVEGHSIDWLPPLKTVEKNAIVAVFHALKCVMEALRVALKTRHVTTEPYVYDLAKKHIQSGRRNREAVFRIIAIYGRETVTISDTVEKLFSFVEDAN